MADVGELVKLGDGRWARYQQCTVYGQGGPGGLSLLVAVELDERTQRMLDAAESARGFEAGPPSPPRLDRVEMGSAPAIAATAQ